MIGLLQISDIHLSHNSENPIVDRANLIARAVCSRTKDCETLIVIVSGDIANTGATLEYEIAEKFLTVLREAILRESPNLDGVYVITVPGNHDCDFSIEDDVRDIVIEHASTKRLSPKLIETCTSVQDNYFVFQEIWDADKDDGEFSRILSTVRFEHTHGIIEIVRLNTAWVSRIEEKQGTLYYPSELLNNLPKSDDDTTRIAVMHHPLHWQNQNQVHDLRKKIEGLFDLILTGHEHFSDAYLKQNELGPLVNYLEGGELQSTSKPNLSSFNLLTINPQQKLKRITRFQLRGELYEPDQDEQWTQFQPAAASRNEFLGWTSEFKGELNDPGAGYRHPRESTLKLDDLFLYPDFQEQEAEGDGQQRIVRGANVLAEILKRKRMVITGDANAGKSALCRRVSIDLRKKGIFPILITKEILEFGHSSTRLSNFIDDSIKEQYGVENVESFKQQETSSKAIIVDNFGTNGVDNQAIENFIDHISKRFEIIMLVAPVSMQIQDFYSDSDQIAVLVGFAWQTIREFGHKQRWALVERWVDLGSDATDDRKDLQRGIDRKLRLIESVLHSGLVPSRPFYILVLLQELELESTLSDQSAGYAHLYEVLVMEAVHQLPGKHSIDIANNYLSELAFHLQKENRSGLSRTDIIQWHQEYSAKFDEQIDIDSWLDNLVVAGVFRTVFGEYRFRYPYIYYFFVAKHLRDHLNEESIQETIKSLCKLMHQESTSNLMLMICHMCKDDFILDSLLRTANELFNSSPLFDAKTSGRFLEIPSESPLELSNSDFETQKNRQKRLEQLDNRDQRMTAREDARSDEENERDDEKDLGQMSHAAASRIVQVLGQVLRNYSGSLTARRKRVVLETTYGLGLRALGSVFSEIKEHRSTFLRSVERGLKENWEKDQIGISEAKEIRSKAEKFISLRLREFAFFVVKHISRSIGTERVDKALTDVANRMGLTAAIIDLSIRLDHFDEFPMHQLEKVRKECGKHWFPNSITQWIVVDHLFLNKVAYHERQKACSILKIKLTEKKVISIQAAR